MNKSSYDVVVIGAGFAGAPCAAELAEKGFSVLLVDKEQCAGTHSSGRNAGMIRQAVEDPEISDLAVEGAEAIRKCALQSKEQSAALLQNPKTEGAKHFTGVRYHQVGSLLGGAHKIPAAARKLFHCTELSTAEAGQKVELLKSAKEQSWLFTPSDGIVDVDSWLQHFFERFRLAGGELAFSCELLEVFETQKLVEGESRRSITGLKLSTGTVECKALVMAAGAWAAEWGQRMDLSIGMLPLKRHIMTTDTPANLEALVNWPWVWDLSTQYYFRPESAGLLWSACEEIEDKCGDAKAESFAPMLLASKLEQNLPEASGLGIKHSWAGHRSFFKDRRFLLGPDPRLEGWFWSAGLGGHGVTVSAAVGRRLANAVHKALGTKKDNHSPHAEASIPAAHAFRPQVCEDWKLAGEPLEYSCAESCS